MMSLKFTPSDRRPVRKIDTSALVAEFEARGGTVRRFERGASSDYGSIKQFLLDHGWRLNQNRNLFTLSQVGAKGRAPRTTWSKVILRVDEIRQAKGLTPIVRRTA
jgi:hypothetical protein